MQSTRWQLARFLPAGLAILGGLSGVGLIVSFPPQHPDDRIFALAVVGTGLALLGLLFGMLGRLWLTRQAGCQIMISALAIPAAFAGWFINGKAGRWEAAWVFATIGGIATAAFLVSALVWAVRDRS